MRYSLQLISQNEKSDLCDIRNNKSLMKKLDKNEEILFSCKIDKYNRKLKRQERVFLLTTSAIYNIKSDKI